MGNPFKRAFNTVKKLGEKKLKSDLKTAEEMYKLVSGDESGSAAPAPPKTIAIAQTYMGNYDLTNVGTLPNTATNNWLGTQVQSLLNQGVATKSIFYPTITNYGLATALINTGEAVNGCVQPPELFNHGFLSKIVVHIATGGTVTGLLQYFGDIPGVLIGKTDSSAEVPFNIVMGDYITQAWVAYADIGAAQSDGDGVKGPIAAIRFFTECGDDSGWIGSLSKAKTFCNYMSFVPPSQASPQHLLLRPIYCFDAWTKGVDSPHWTLGARFTNPYEVTVVVGTIAPVTTSNLAPDTNPNVAPDPDSTAADPPVYVSDAWSRSWRFCNGSSTPQEMTMSDTLTSSSTHTLTKTETDSKSVSTSTSLAVSATAIFEAGSATASWSRTTTATSTHTTSTSDSVTMSSSSEQYFSYPLVVPPNSCVECTVAVYQGFSQAPVSLGVSWAGGARSTMQLYYIGTDDIEMRIDITETPLTPVS